MNGLRSVLFVPIAFLLATCSLYYLAKCAPDTQQVRASSGADQSSDSSRTVLHFPNSLADLKDISKLLLEYRSQHSTYVFVLFVCAYVYKQTFAIPGSIFLNILAGALYGLKGGFPLVCILTASGASCCFLLSKCFGCQSIQYYFPDKVSSLQQKVDDNRDRLFYFLLFVRLFPITPNWFINIASPVLNVPLHLFFVSVLLGLMPYNFVSVQTGVVLSEIRSLDDVLSFDVIFKLLVIALVALVPTLFVKTKVKKAVDFRTSRVQMIR